MTHLDDSEHGMQRWATVVNLVFLSAYVFTYLRFAQVHQNEKALNAEFYGRKIARVGRLSEFSLICVLTLSMLVLSADAALRLFGVLLIHILYGVVVYIGYKFSTWTPKNLRENRLCRFAFYLIFALPVIVDGCNALNLGLALGVITMAVLLHPLSQRALSGSRQSLDKKSAAWH